MPYFLLVAVLCGIPMLPGCSPTFNWRDVRSDQTPLVALFPCKPDLSARVVSLGAQDVSMTMWACDAGGATFAVAYADIKVAADAGAALGQWKSATLGHLRAPSPSELPYLIKGASAMPPAVQVQTRGLRPDGSGMAVHAVWFAQGSQVFQAALYADTVSPALAETFFSGLRLQ